MDNTTCYDPAQCIHTSTCTGVWGCDLLDMLIEQRTIDRCLMNNASGVTNYEDDYYFNDTYPIIEVANNGVIIMKNVLWNLLFSLMSYHKYL
jgi:hypothetical protein